MRKKGITQIGLRYTIFAAVVLVIQLGISIGLNIFAPDIMERHGILLSFLLIIVSVDVIGFPLILQLTRKLPAATLPQSNLGIGKFILGIFFCSGITGVGMVIGTVIHVVLSLLLGGDGLTNITISSLMMNSGVFMRILTVGILAPIFEELIFRKVLVDHLAKYGKALAIAASGLLFGLFHGNFSQFFFTAGLGFFFAYVYIKTGKIRYTIAYHMIINMTSAVISVPLSAKYLAALEIVDMSRLASGSMDAAMRQALPSILIYLGWMGILIMIGIIGLILLCVNLKNFKLQEEEPDSPSFWKSFKELLSNPGILMFTAICLIIFVKTYVF